MYFYEILNLHYIFNYDIFFCTSGNSSTADVNVMLFCRQVQEKEEVLLNSSSTGSPAGPPGEAAAQVQYTDVR